MVDYTENEQRPCVLNAYQCSVAELVAAPGTVNYIRLG